MSDFVEWSLPESLIAAIMEFLDGRIVAQCLCIAKSWAKAGEIEKIKSKVRLAYIDFSVTSSGIDDLISLYKSEHGFKSATDLGDTILHLAAQYRKRGLIEALILEGLPVEVKGKDGMTPLHISCVYGDWDQVSLMLEAGGSIFSTDADGRTPLHCACFDRTSKIVLDNFKGCVEEGPNSSKSKDDLVREGTQIVEELLKHGAELNARGRRGESPLWYAAYAGCEATVAALLHAGAETT